MARMMGWLTTVHFGNYSSSLPRSFEFYSQSRLLSLNINEDNILKVMKAVNINWSHGHDFISKLSLPSSCIKGCES